MPDVAQALRWLLVLLGLGWLGFPIAWRLFGRLPDRGAFMARPLALLLVTYGAWLTASLRLLPFRTAVWGVGLPLLLILALLALVWRRSAPGLRLEPVPWSLWLVHELLTIAVFLGFAWLRGFNPDITFTEKPMELMLLNSVLRSDSMPPLDGWLAGESVNYYYLGYVVAGALTIITGAPIGFAFNLMLTTMVAVVAAAVFGVTASLWLLRTCEERRQPMAGAIAVGLLGVYLVVLAGNLNAGWRWLTDPATTWAESWWGGIGWQSSRVVVDVIAGAERQTINEFPWFSFLLGDLHPHVLSLPFSLLALGVVVDWWRRSPALDSAGSMRLAWSRLLAGALAVGSLYAINSWDFPLYLLLALVALARPAWEHSVQQCTWRRVAATAAAFVVASILLFVPFYLTFRSFAGRQALDLPAPISMLPGVNLLLRLVGVVTWERTSLSEYLLVFGLPSLAAAGWLLVLARRGLRLHPNVLGLILVAIALAGTLLGSAVVAVAGGLVATALVVWRSGRLTSSEALVCLLLAVGFGLPVVAEFVFLQDVFGDRMNTVFKAYYQAWLLLGVVSALGTGALLQAIMRLARQGQLRPLWLLAGLGGALAAALVMTLGYPVIATSQRTEHFRDQRGLDGLAYLARLPDEQAALAWIAAEAAGAVVAEDPGQSYGEYFGMPHARVATIAGSLAPLGWPGHELQWRGGQPPLLTQIGTRLQDMHLLYATTDPAVAREIIERYHIEYVYVGAWERDQEARQRARQPVYSEAALAKFGTFMDVAFQQDRVTIYQRRAS